MTIAKAKERMKTYIGTLKLATNIPTEMIEAFEVGVECIEIVENLYEILPEGGVEK